MKIPEIKIKHVNIALMIEDMERKPPDITWPQVVLIGLDKIEKDKMSKVRND